MKATKKKATPATPATPATFIFTHASIEGEVELAVYEGTITADAVSDAVGALDAPPITVDTVIETVRGVETSFEVVRPSILATWLSANAGAGVRGAADALSGPINTSATSKGDRTAQLSASVRRTSKDKLVKRLRKLGLPKATSDNAMPYLSSETASATTFKESARRERQGQGMLLRLAICIASGDCQLPTTNEVVPVDYSDLLATWIQ